MSTSSEDVRALRADSPGIAPPTLSETRPMYWSVRRELWENRSIWVAPLIVASVVLFGLLIRTIRLPQKIRSLEVLEPGKLHDTVVLPLSMAPAPIMLATFLVAVFYCLDALYGERRERSILFWKSMPVSDRTTVLSKAAVPLVVLPLIAFVLSVAVQLTMLVVTTPVLLGSAVSPATLWAELRFFQGLVIMVYGLTVHALWFAPIYGWLLLVSAWARRAPFLWAVLPPLALFALERLAFGTRHSIEMLKYRVTGAMKSAFALEPDAGGNVERLSQLSPINFLTTPGLWIGLTFTVLFLAAAMRLRRNREPI